MSRLIALLTTCACSTAFAFTNYVDLGSTNPLSPYTSWATSATNIQDAADAHNSDSGTVVVADGVYAITTEIIIPGDINVTSLNGPYHTIIDAGGLTIDSVSLGNYNSFAGFTVQNGSRGIIGGIITNCIVQYNYNANSYGAGILFAQVYNSIIRNNYSLGFGGGLYNSSAYDCTIEGNMSFEGYGGGAYESGLYRCYIANNSALRGGGLAGEFYSNRTAKDSVFINNYASPAGGGAIYEASAYNCTFIGNDSSATFSKVIMRDPSHESVRVEAVNCIFDNEGMTQSEMLGDALVRFSCGPALLHGALGNITNNPQFVSGSYRLSAASPCVDAGFNPNVSSDTDKDGNPRIVGGTVDMGAYEWQTAESATILPITVLLQSSPDMLTWTNSGESVEWLVPANASNSFYRTILEM